MMESQKKKLQREDAILSLLKKLDYLSRSQLQRLHHLSGDRNARRVLANMNRYLSYLRRDIGENVYYLNKSGRERIGSNVIRQKTNQTGHFLMRADTYIHYTGSQDWRNELKFSVEGVTIVIPDDYYLHNLRRHF